MSKNKLIVLFIIILIIVCTFLVLLTNQGDNLPDQTTPPTGNNSFPVTIPPSGTEGSSIGQNLRNNTSYQYAEPGNEEDLKNIINKSLQKKDYPKDINWESYATKDNKQVALDDFATAIGIEINSQLDKFLDKYNYDRIVCKNNSGKLDYGLVINNKLFSNYPTLAQEQTAILRSWEPTMLRDLHKILYPDTNFTEQSLNQTLSFKNGKYRYAEIVFPDNNEGSLNYHIIVDSIVFTSSPECMDRASQAIEGIE